MPVSPTLKKALLAGAVATAFGGGLYWKYTRPRTPPAGATALSKLPYDQLGPLSENDRQILADAEELFYDGQYAEAVVRLKQFQSREGNGHLRAALLAGRCLLNLDQYAEAEQAFLFVLDKLPDEPDAHRGLATVYGFLGATAREETHLRKVADLDPSDYKPLMLIATNYVDLRVYPPAEEAAREGLKRHPPPDAEAALRRDLAEALLGQKKFTEAVDVLAGDKSAPGRAVRAECLRMLDRPADAEKEIAAGLAVAAGDDPKAKARLLVQRGWLLMDRRDDAGAAKALEGALADDEHNLGARLQLAQAYRRLGDAARADAAEGKFRDSEARLKKLSGLNHEAVERPWDGAVRRELADAYRALNLNALADHWLRAAAACEARKSGAAP